MAWRWLRGTCTVTPAGERATGRCRLAAGRRGGRRLAAARRDHSDHDGYLLRSRAAVDPHHGSGHCTVNHCTVNHCAINLCTLDLCAVVPNFV